MTILVRLFITAGAISTLAAQSVYVPVNAPYAQSLVLAEQEGHPELQKLGLHAIPPGQQDYAIAANTFPSKIGKKSSASDLAVVKSGVPSVKFDERGGFFDLCLPISDSAGRPVGITVMEIPRKFAKDADAALAKATVVRNELRDKITSNAQLFEETGAPLKALQTIRLQPAVKGRFDHFGIDLKHNRLFAAAEDYHAVLVYDLVTSAPITEIAGIARPHAIFYRDDLDRLYVTDGETGALKIIDGKTYKPMNAVALAKDADAIGYDAPTHNLYVVNGGKDAGQAFSFVSAVDTSTAKKVTDIRIEGETLEAMALDIWRPRMYVNNKARNEVTVVDRWQQKVVGSWPVTIGKENVACLDVDVEELDRVIDAAENGPLSKADRQKLKATLHALVERLAQKRNTEKTNSVLEPRNSSPAATESPEPEPSAPAGHGRNAASAFTGAEKVSIQHAQLKPGDPCPECREGRVYRQKEPKTLVRIVGQAPLKATVFEMERLRCNACCQVFTAEEPAGDGAGKYEMTAVAMIALLKYGTGMPFNRMERLEEQLGMPLAAAT